MTGRHGSVEERFWRYVDRSAGPDGCWLWTGSRQPKGYGRLRVDGEVQLAHRVAYELFVGPIPEGMTLDHRCRQTSCVNPTHLAVETAVDNWRLGPGQRAGQCRRGHDPARFFRRANGEVVYCRDCRNEDRRARYREDPTYRDSETARREALRTRVSATGN